VVRWNSHKGYLLELAAAGVPVVPTVLLRQGANVNLATIMSEQDWTRVVVKPAVSASSYRTLHADAETLDEGDAHLRELLAERDVLVQPYISSVEDYGERAVIWIDGSFTHSVRKSPRFSADDEAVSEALPIAEDERLVVQQALAFVNQPLLYARIDLARDSDGRPQVMELELIEPSLYLLQSPDALSRLVSAICARARTS
jgi:glutathione synthase/RimK-type ligase-like ATP-grasp enzyme